MSRRERLRPNVFRALRRWRPDNELPPLVFFFTEDPPSPEVIETKSGAFSKDGGDVTIQMTFWNHFWLEWTPLGENVPLAMEVWGNNPEGQNISAANLQVQVFHEDGRPWEGMRFGHVACIRSESHQDLGTPDDGFARAAGAWLMYTLAHIHGLLHGRVDMKGELDLATGTRKKPALPTVMRIDEGQKLRKGHRVSYRRLDGLDAVEEMRRMEPANPAETDEERGAGAPRVEHPVRGHWRYYRRGEWSSCDHGFRDTEWDRDDPRLAVERQCSKCGTWARFIREHTRGDPEVGTTTAVYVGG